MDTLKVLPKYTQRLLNWPNLLNQYLVAAQQQPFEWGVHDCCLFVAGALEEITGIDYMPEFKGTYTTQEGAYESLGLPAGASQEELHQRLVEVLTEKFGPPISPLQGSKGDIAIFEGALGIVIGPQALFLHAQGFSILKLRRVGHVFKVPM